MKRWAATEDEPEWDDVPARVSPFTVLDTPEDEGTADRGGWSWGREYRANRWHDCTGCRDIIGPGDHYLREAVLLSPFGTCAGRTVLVTKLCCACRPDPV